VAFVTWVAGSAAICTLLAACGPRIALLKRELGCRAPLRTGPVEIRKGDRGPTKEVPAVTYRAVYGGFDPMKASIEEIRRASYFNEILRSAPILGASVLYLDCRPGGGPIGGGGRCTVTGYRWGDEAEAAQRYGNREESCAVFDPQVKLLKTERLAHRRPHSFRLQVLEGPPSPGWQPVVRFAVAYEAFEPLQALPGELERARGMAAIIALARQHGASAIFRMKCGKEAPGVGTCELLGVAWRGTAQ
jgi:hypothetical protein